MERGMELEAVIDGLLKNYLSRNLAARGLQAALDEVGVGFRPVVDHLTIRTLDIDRRAEEFLRLGYSFSETLNYDDWFAKVYRAPGFPPLFIDQAYPDARGASIAGAAHAPTMERPDEFAELVLHFLDEADEAA